MLKFKFAFCFCILKLGNVRVEIVISCQNEAIEA